MRPLRHALRLGMPPVVALALLAGPAPAAFAEEDPGDDRPVMLLGDSELLIYVGSTFFRVCVEGNLREPTAQLASYWYLRIEGVRGTQTFTGTNWTGSAQYVYHCEYVYRYGTSEGLFSADFGYVGAAGYVFAHSTGGGMWSPTTGPQTWGVDLTAP